MRIIKRILASLLIIIVLLAIALVAGGYVFLSQRWPQTNGEVHVPGLTSRVEVYRDPWGIPHIYAHNLEDLYFAQGYVHAQDRLWQMEFQRRVGHGRLSEILGEATLDTDRFLRTIGITRAAQKDLEAMSPEAQGYLEAYSRGVTAYIETHRGRLPLEFVILGFEPEPWQPVDTLGWAKMMAWDLGGNWESELLRARLIQALGQEKVAELVPRYPLAGPFIIPPEVKDYSSLGAPDLSCYRAMRRSLGLTPGFLAGLGSNNWVVGSKTTTGKPLLANDPHLGIQMPSIWYEIGLHAPGMNVVGASLPGTAGVVIGHNDYIAWGMTNVGPDVQDLYIEHVRGDEYEYQGQWLPLTVIREEIRVKGWDEPEVLEVRLTNHGPLINDVIEGLEEPVAFKWTATAEAIRVAESLFRLNQARNWEEFREALRLWDVPSQNFVYADVEGNIGYQMSGLVPIRRKGQGLVPVPGWTGEYEWTGYIPFEELPSVYNPASGFIVTANNQVVPDDYPYFISAEWAAPYRAQRIVDLLSSRDKLSVEDFKAIQADTYSIPGSILTPYLLQLRPEGWLQEKALEELARWDHRVEADSPGAAIFEVTYRELVLATFGDELGEELMEGYLPADDVHTVAMEQLLAQPAAPWWDDRATPAVETRDQILARAFARAVDWLGSRFGDVPAEWRWGRLHTATFVHQPLGQSGIALLERMLNRGPIPARGSGFTVDAAGFNYNEPYGVRVLASYRQIIDLSDFDASWSMHTTGQSGHPFHSHYGDMINAWQGVEYHPMLFSRGRVQGAKVAVLVLTP